MATRLPSGGLDAICGWLHSRMCYTAVVDSDDTSHGWRDHSRGRTYADDAHRLVAALDARGLAIVRKKDADA